MAKTLRIKKKTVIGLGVLLLILGFGFRLTGSAVAGPGQYDSFAQCLTESGATFYGAYWCPHCNSQKAMFGSSVKYVDYVECSLPNRGGQIEECNDAGITGYPTWVFADGSRASGALPLETLGIRSGCSLTGENYGSANS